MNNFSNNQPVFGGANSAFSNTQQSNTPSFGNTAPSGGGVFGNSTNNNANFNSPSNLIHNGANGIFGASGQQTNNSTFGGGGNGNQGNTFGNTPNNNNGNGVFGNSSFNKPNTGGTGWGGNNNTSNTSVGVFGNGSANTSGNTFGNTQQQQGGGFNKPFGNTSNTNTFSTNQQTQQNNPFGGSTNTSNLGVSNSPFGGQGQNQGQQNNQGGFGLNQGQSNFGGGSSPFSNQQNQQSQSTFGTSNNNTFGNSSFSNTKPNTFGQNNATNNNTYGGTSWGVPTNGTTQTNQKFTPLKSKNHKIDHKHLVKCLLLLDENTGMSLNELRIRHLSTGGAPGNAVNAGNSAFSNSSFGNTQQQGGNTSAFSFGGGNNNNTNKGFATSNSSFSSFSQTNNNQTSSSPFGGNTGSTFGSSFTNPTSNTNTSTFGNLTTPTTSAFGNNTNNTTAPNFGGTGTSAFGSPSTSAFGTNQAGTGTGSAFNFGSQPTNENKNTFSFGNSQNNQGSSFSFGGTNNNQTSSMFSGLQGSSNTPLLGQTNTTTSSIFGGSGSTPATNTPSLFGGQGQPAFSSMGQNTSIPNANPDILQAIVNGGFFSSDVSKQFFKEEKTPFDKLMDDNSGHYDELVFSKTKNQLLTGSIDDNMLFGKGLENSSSNSYKFKHPFDFGDDDCYDYIDYDRKEQKKEVIVKKPQKVREMMTSLVRDQKNQKIRDQYNRLKDIKTKEKLVKKSDLPALGNYVLTPSLEELQTKSVNELKRIQDVVIENEFGKVEFLEPISLLKKNLGEGIEICQDLIEIVDGEWDNKKCKMTFNNFGNYTSKQGQEREKLKKKMVRWLSKNNMKKNDFDNRNGNLQVELIL